MSKPGQQPKSRSASKPRLSKKESRGASAPGGVHSDSLFGGEPRKLGRLALLGIALVLLLGLVLLTSLFMSPAE